MPIVPSITTTRLSQDDFQPIASEVMRHVFDIHNEFGRFRDTLMALIHDWGTGLEISLYEEGLIHFLGGEADVDTAVPVLGSKSQVAVQHFRLVAPNVAFKLTAISDRHEAFITHARRLIQHTTLTAIHWANITTNLVTFTTIR